MLYLQSLGIDIDNEPFREHAGYFRDALVRSNYASIRDGIVPDNSFLMMFFENILLHAGHDLEVQDLRCKELFDDQKQDKEYSLLSERHDMDQAKDALVNEGQSIKPFRSEEER